MEEKYIPSSKEIQEAESMMTEKEKTDSDKREKDVESRIRIVKREGFDRDFLNMTPMSEESLHRNLEKWISSYATGMPYKIKTYTQRFIDEGHQYVVDASDPKKVEELDRLILEAMEIARTGDKELFKQKIREIWSVGGQRKH